jgi:hypothetical protein
MSDQNDCLAKVFRRGKELAEIDGKLWDELSGAERNQYYSRADESLIAEELLLIFGREAGS